MVEKTVLIRDFVTKDPEGLQDPFINLGFVDPASRFSYAERGEAEPDYRNAASNGIDRPDHNLEIQPDCPAPYLASEGKAPDRPSLGRWFVLPDGQNPSVSYYNQPGHREPLFLRLTKTAAVKMAYYKDEPQVGRDAGFVLEGYIAGTVTGSTETAIGAGLMAEDGYYQYSLLFVDSPTVRTVGILKSSSLLGDLSGYYLPLDLEGKPVPVDFTQLHMYQMVVDRFRDKITLYVDGKVLIQPITLSSATLPPTALRRVNFGYVYPAAAPGEMQIAKIDHLTRYTAWEGSDLLLPDAVLQPVAARYTKVATGAGSVSGFVTIDKTAVGVSGSHLFYERDADFGEYLGSQVDVKVRVAGYKNSSGRSFASRADTGVGVELRLGAKLLHLGFYDCGIYGRRVGIVPGSGSVDDILDLTLLGSKFSTLVDWTKKDLYRVMIRAFKSIDVIVGPPESPPVISIPWRGNGLGFDLPEDATPSSIAFGHFAEGPSSTTEWDYVRYGLSCGYDHVVRQTFPTGLKSYHFSGRALFRVEGSDT